MNRQTPVCGIAAALLVAVGNSPVLPAANPAPPDFARDIEPLFIKRCYECHGPDQQKSKLRLDFRADAMSGGKSGKPAIVPGRSVESELFARITSQDPDEVMPSKGAPLSAEQIAALQAWIDSGAVWPEKDPKQHWSFQKPARPQPPAVTNSRWAGNDIDRFVLARLEHEGLAPMPEADRATLIRRLSLDLTGLPPTIDEVTAFSGDRGKDAYERLVDRLLASPHFGENLARWWLDLARYADSNGYQVDSERSMWPYRDWVIQAFNRNMPFDQFTIEQLAGDLLPNATLSQKIATGFNRNSKTNDEGGGDDEEYRTKAVKDRVATTATAWLGLTMMCAECHTHKYDPITHDDYYRFYALFNNTADRGNNTGPSVAVPAPSQQPQVDWLHMKIAALQKQLAEAERNLPSEQEAWERRIAGKTNVWTVLNLTNSVSTGGATFTNLADGSILATGVNSIYDTYLLETSTDLAKVSAVLLEVLPDPSLPHKGPGRWRDSGNFILDDMGMKATPVDGGASTIESVAFGKATADWEQQYYLAEHAVDRNPKTGWAIGPRFGQPHFLIAELENPVRFSGGARLGFKFDFYHGSSHTIGRLRLSVTSGKDPELLWPIPPEVAGVLAIPSSERTPEQRRRLTAHYRSSVPSIRALDRELFALNQREAELAKTAHTTLVMQERAEPRQTYVHVRGNFLEKGREVTPGMPAIFPPLPGDEPANRLALARWLVSTNNPLTARVTVNQLWERLFGTGIVKTSDDFGRQGEAPSHPELLDWLASEFVQPSVPDSTHPKPWDIKRLLKLMVMSSAYRQSAATDPVRSEKDPYNRLLSRGPRFRMDAEMIRDQSLALSGLLNPEIGGPSVHPVQVPNLWKEIGFLRPEIGMDEWPVSVGPELYRRGLYTFWRRVCTYPTFATFDAPSRDVCVGRRPRTNTPLQALAALNEPTLLEAARVFAQRIMLEGGNEPSKQIEFAFRTCLSRSPARTEKERLLKFYEQQLRSFQDDARAARLLVSVGAADHPPGLDPRTLAAWMMVANALLNLDETVTKG